MQNDTTQALKMILVDPLTALGHEMITVIPNILGALAILVVGYFVAKLARLVVKKFIEKFSINTLSDKAGATALLKKIDDELTLSALLSQLVYYIILITFIMSATEALQMQIMADALKSILLYLPNIFATIFVLIFGFMIANTSQKVISKSSAGMNLEFSEALGKIVYIIIAIITISLAIAQLEIETALLNQAASIILIAVGVALALSLGLGTKELSSVIIAGNYVRDIYHVGDRITVDGVSGEILSVGTTKTIIKTDEEKEVFISNEILLKSKTIKG